MHRACVGPPSKNITRAYVAMLTFLAPSIFTVITEDVPGVQNNGADTLFRPSQLPT